MSIARAFSYQLGSISFEKEEEEEEEVAILKCGNAFRFLYTFQNP